MVRSLDQPLLNELHGGRVPDKPFEHLEQLLMGDGIKKLGDIRIHQPALPDAHPFAGLGQGGLHTAARTVAVGIIMKQGLGPRFQDNEQGSLPSTAAGLFRSGRIITGTPAWFSTRQTVVSTRGLP